MHTVYQISREGERMVGMAVSHGIRLEQIQGNVLTYATKHKETEAFSTENCLLQVVQEDR